MVHPGLEEVAAEEIDAATWAARSSAPAAASSSSASPEIDASLLRLRTTEDVFLLAWGTDQLTYRAEDLDSIRRWTAHEADWDQLLRLHHAVRPKPKGKPTYRLVTQMKGEHGYRRVDARQGAGPGAGGQAAGELAAGRGERRRRDLADHRRGHGGLRPAAVRPDHAAPDLQAASICRPRCGRRVAAAMVRLAEIRPRHVVLDPMCGAGTILAEALAYSRMRGWDQPQRQPVQFVFFGKNRRRDGPWRSVAEFMDVTEPRPEGSAGCRLLKMWCAQGR